MSSLKPSAAIFSVDEIIIMTDAEIARLMRKNRRSNGDIELLVDGWDRISKNERNRLAERLMCVTIFFFQTQNDSYIVTNIFIQGFKNEPWLKVLRSIPDPSTLINSTRVCEQYRSARTIRCRTLDHHQLTDQDLPPLGSTSMPLG